MYTSYTLNHFWSHKGKEEIIENSENQLTSIQTMWAVFNNSLLENSYFSTDYDSTLFHSIKIMSFAKVFLFN